MASIDTQLDKQAFCLDLSKSVGLSWCANGRLSGVLCAFAVADSAALFRGRVSTCWVGERAVLGLVHI